MKPPKNSPSQKGFTILAILLLATLIGLFAAANSMLLGQVKKRLDQIEERQLQKFRKPSPAEPEKHP